MSVLRILVVGRHPQIMAKVKGLLESASYTALGALSDEEAIALMGSAAPDALLVGERHNFYRCIFTEKTEPPIMHKGVLPEGVDPLPYPLSGGVDDTLGP